MGRRGKQIPIAIDQLINALFNGYATETLSATVWRKRNEGKWWSRAVWFIDKLFFWEKNHCADAFKNKVNGKHEPPEYMEIRKNGWDD